MSDQRTQGGFIGDPAAALTVTGSSACCGNAARNTDVLAGDPHTSAAGPCCGTQAAAQAEGSCCAGAAKTEAVAAGKGCCG